MKASLDCIPCIQRQTIESLRMNIKDKKTREKILRKVLGFLKKIDWSKTPIELSNKVQLLVSKETGIKDPYKKVKKLSNDLALKLYPRLKRIINSSSDPINTAVRISIAGNIIDFGPQLKDRLDIKRAIQKVLKEKFDINDYNELRRKLEKAKNLLFFADNSGEIVLDKLLIETILKFKKNLKITLVVRGGPSLNDVTIKDIKYIGLNKIPNIKIKAVSNGDPKTGPKLNSKEVESWIKNHDVVISKGQGNYEGLSQFKNIFFLLIAKCKIIGKELGVKEGGIILKYKRR